MFETTRFETTRSQTTIRKTMRGAWPLAAGLALAVLLAAAPASAQRINLDRPLQAGELILFPDIQDDSAWYYVSDKPRLATGDDGRPQFSFLRWVDNVRSGADEAEAREGEGGGIVHAVVALDVTEDQVQDARRELQRLEPGAEIRGPAVFKSGRFALVSSFAEADGRLTERVVGMGSAPIMDGQKAAVSILLTKEGAKILWESFNTATPDISFSFEMQLDGFREPVEGKVEAHFDQIYEHEAFSVGVASQMLAAEINGAFDDLQRSGAIEVTEIGTDQEMSDLLRIAYNKLTDLMFQPINGTGTPDLASLAGAASGGGGMLDRATNMLQQNRAEARQENERIRRENRQEMERVRREEERQASRDDGDSGGGDGGEEAEGGEEDRPRLTESDPPEAGEMTRDNAPEARPEPNLQEEVSVPSFSIVAAFEMKKVRQRGDYVIDLNKSLKDSLTLRFDENIGDLTRFRDDERVFHQVNLDDDLYRQRELVVFLDGLNAGDFDQYVNFVTVQLKKVHDGGAETVDEVRIDRNNFNREGNAFKLLYGWNGDQDRRNWMEYQYAVHWSFFGGHEMEEPFRERDSGAIPVAAPLERRVVELDGDPELMSEAGVRAVTVEVFYPVGEQELSRRITLNARKGEASEQIEYLAPPGVYDYDYEITWRLTGNRTVTTGRQSTDQGLLFIDEVPTT